VAAVAVATLVVAAAAAVVMAVAAAEAGARVELQLPEVMIRRRRSAQRPHALSATRLDTRSAHVQRPQADCSLEAGEDVDEEDAQRQKFSCCDRNAKR
jgi:hypothetical protein